MARRTISESNHNCYVYAISVDGIVRYIGKGTGRRSRVHLQIAAGINRRRDAGETVKTRKLYNRFAKALKAGAAIEIRHLAEGLTAEQAFLREQQEIAAATSDLWNTTGGGEGLDSKTAKAMWSDADYRAKAIALKRSPEARAKASAATKRHFSDPEQRKASRARTKALWESEEFREKTSAACRPRWNDPEFRERHKAAITKGWEEHPERRAKRSEISKSYASKDSFRDATSLRFREMWEDPEFRAKSTAHWTDPDRKAAIIKSWTSEFLEMRGKAISRGLAESGAMKRVYADPRHRERLRDANKAHWGNPEARAAQSERMKALWQDPEYRAKTTAHWAEKRKARNDKS